MCFDAYAFESTVSRAAQPPEHRSDETGYTTIARLVHEQHIEGVDGNARLHKDYEDDEVDHSKMINVEVPEP